MLKKIILLVLSILLFTEVSVAFAYEIPEFTSCVNPKGEVLANYETGTHGIVGKPGLFEGKDSVYKVSENSVTQCFCAVDGSGIQTNFWKVSQLSESEIEALKSQGWVYVPNGASWGLDDSSYMAKNSDFSCKSSGGSNDSSSNNSSSSSNNSGSTSGSGGTSAGIGAVLGLASTGNIVFVLGTALTSGLSLILGLILKKRAKITSK